MRPSPSGPHGVSALAALEPGETQRVAVEIDRRSLSYWDEESDRWVTPSGRVLVYVGSSSRDITLQGTIEVSSG